MPRVAALEVPHRFGESESQLQWIEAHLPPADLVVLPEAILTGYISSRRDSDLTPFAEPRQGPTEVALCALAQRSGRALLGPLIERDESGCYNSALFIDANGDVLAHYRKRHPWFLEEWATAGSSPLPVFSWRGLKLTIAICYDAQFLAQESIAQLTAADALLFASAWTEYPPDTREPLLSGLAKTFGCAVVNANWGVGRPRIPGQGRSLIIGRDGKLLAEGAAPLAELSPTKPSAPAQVIASHIK